MNFTLLSTDSKAQNDVSLVFFLVKISLLYIMQITEVNNLGVRDLFILNNC